MSISNRSGWTAPHIPVSVCVHPRSSSIAVVPSLQLGRLRFPSLSFVSPVSHCVRSSNQLCIALFSPVCQVVVEMPSFLFSLLSRSRSPDRPGPRSPGGAGCGLLWSRVGPSGSPLNVQIVRPCILSSSCPCIDSFPSTEAKRAQSFRQRTYSSVASNRSALARRNGLRDGLSRYRHQPPRGRGLELRE